MLYGSICLTDIPKELIKVGRNGKKYLSISVWERRTQSQYGHTHYIKADCKKEEQREGVNYFIGDLKTSTPRQDPEPTRDVSEVFPPKQEEVSDDLPF